MSAYSSFSQAGQQGPTGPTGSTGPTGPSGSSGLSSIVREVRSSNTILGTGDNGKTIEFSANFTQTFTAAATLGSGWWCILRTQVGIPLFYVTLDPNSSELINGLPTARLSSGTTVLVTCSGSAFYTETLCGVMDPSDLPQVAAWYDFADTSTITNAGGGAVSQVTDKSGNGHTISEATNRPTTGTRTINGLNVLDYDGSNDQLRRTGTIFIGPGNMYAVCEPDSVTSIHIIVRATDNQPAIYTSGTTLVTEMNASTGGSVAGSVSIGVPFLSAMIPMSSINNYGRSAGTNSSITATSSVAQVWTQINVGVQLGGGSLFFDGGIAEIVLCDIILGPQEDFAVRNYLANKWNVTA